jgi:hypothetical protein
METVPIPLAALDSPEYVRLTPAQKAFLIELYRVHGDVERFTVDLRNPAVYRQSFGAYLSNKITPLVKHGLLVEDGEQQVTICNWRRVFRFRYSALGELQEAA